MTFARVARAKLGFRGLRAWVRWRRQSRAVSLIFRRLANAGLPGTGTRPLHRSQATHFSLRRAFLLFFFAFSNRRFPLVTGIGSVADWNPPFNHSLLLSRKKSSPLRRRRQSRLKVLLIIRESFPSEKTGQWWTFSLLRDRCKGFARPLVAEFCPLAGPSLSRRFENPRHRQATGTKEGTSSDQPSHTVGCLASAFVGPWHMTTSFLAGGCYGRWLRSDAIKCILLKTREPHHITALDSFSAVMKL